MRKVVSILALWPIPVAALLGCFLFVATAAERVVMPDWLVGLFIEVPEER
ncbi:MAG: hypothetical protein AAF968_26400 [Pseudomonadota bacterium]